MNKGVIVKIIPNEEAPRDNKGNVFDIIMNPNGVISRKNSGQLLELYSGKILHVVNQKVKSYLDNGKIKQAINEIIILYTKVANKTPTSTHIIESLKSLGESKNKDMLEEFVNQISQSGVQLYLDPIDKLNIKKILDAMKYYGLKTREKIYDPSIGGRTKTSVTFGYMYWAKTEHLSAKKLAARSIGPMQASTGQAIRGKSKEGGQRVDELSIHSLLGYNATNILKEISTLSSDDLKTKFSAINMIYKNGKVRLNDVVKDAKSTSAEQMKVVLQAMGVADPSK